MLAQVTKDVFALGKPRLSGLVLLTTGVGLWLAPTRLPPDIQLLTLLATAVLVWAANALNSYIERDIDARMLRTQTRPLPAKRLRPHIALALGSVLGLVAMLVLWLGTNSLTALLGAVAFVSYLWLYTPLKRYTPWAVVIGALPGAIPPLMGWTATTHELNAGGLTLFALLFAWQIPHFLAIATYLRNDYQRADLKVLAVTHGERFTKLAMLGSVIILHPISLLPAWIGIAGPLYALTASVAGLCLFAACIYGIWTDATQVWAKRVFIGTLVYLTVLLGALFVRLP